MIKILLIFILLIIATFSFGQRGIICDEVLFIKLNERVHAYLNKNYTGYKADRWADINTVLIHKVTGKFLFPIEDLKREGIVRKSLTVIQKRKILEIKKDDKNWYPELNINKN